MPNAAPLSTALGMSPDAVTSMFANPQFQSQLGGLFASSPDLQQSLANVYANNPNFRNSFGPLAQQGNWGAPQTSQMGAGMAPAAGSPYASMYQPPSLMNLSVNPSTGMYGITSSAPQAPVAANTPYDPTSFAQFNAPQQTVQGLAAQAAANAPKQKKPTFWEQIAPLAGMAVQAAMMI